MHVTSERQRVFSIFARRLPHRSWITRSRVPAMTSFLVTASSGSGDCTTLGGNLSAIRLAAARYRQAEPEESANLDEMLVFLRRISRK